ncbi:MAG: hypothetical protein H2042_17650 [Rhizobiales bacterium]|nr:hypothetical protein [Hyphomicrobiales bacterium]
MRAPRRNPAGSTRFAGHPTATVHDTPAGKPVQQLLWGDWLTLTGLAGGAPGWVSVRARGVDGWMREDSIQETRLLEVIFVDIGQGDGALVVTPDDRHLLVDAGEGDNMFRFLRWRYNGFRQPFSFAAAIISHPDADHYKGFKPLFEAPNVSFEALYHNGLVERAGGETLGPRAGGFVLDVVAGRDDLATLLADPAVRGDKVYPNMLHQALASGRVADARALSADDGHLPGFAPDDDGEVVIEVLGPVRDAGPAGEPRLKWFGDVGKTKNGHSVVLRLVYKSVSLLLGGDLNIPAEHHLLAAHTGHAMPPRTELDLDRVIEGGRKTFRSDIAKACHHGSADFTDVFLKAVDPIATVISSGDREPHSHPRADSLGAVGRWGRGSRPLVFSTELARSAPEMIKHPSVLRAQLAAAQSAIETAPEGPKKERARAAFKALTDSIDRSVAVFGAINLRTDGTRIVMAQKIEAPRSPAKKWDVYAIDPDAQGVLRYRSQHE